MLSGRTHETTARIFARTGATCAMTELTADRTGAILAATGVTLITTAAICETICAAATAKTPPATEGTFAVTSAI